MEQELNFYKGICEEQTKKIEELKKELNEANKDNEILYLTNTIRKLKGELNETNKEAMEKTQQIIEIGSKIDELMRKEEKNQLERMALLKKIISLKNGDKGSDTG